MKCVLHIVNLFLEDSQLGLITNTIERKLKKVRKREQKRWTTIKKRERKRKIKSEETIRVELSEEILVFIFFSRFISKKNV